MSEITKVCASCGVSKTLDEYWNHSTGKYGKRSRCKDCVSAENAEHLRRKLEKEPDYNRNRVREWSFRANNKRRSNLATRYGITLEMYESMLAKQGGKCAICGGQMDENKRSAVDHDHTTGEVRGILHCKCNTAIALLCESPKICRMAANYLENHGRV
jgi:hypothetical protein